MPPPKVVYPKRTDTPSPQDYKHPAHRGKFPYELRVQYLKLVRMTGRFYDSAEKIHVPVRQVLLARREDKDFDEACENAKQGYVDDVLVREATRRAIEGVDVPMIGRVGKDEDGIICYQKRYSDGILQLLLRAARQEFRQVDPGATSGGKSGSNKYEAPAGGVLLIPEGPATAQAWEEKFKQVATVEDPPTSEPEK